MRKALFFPFAIILSILVGYYSVVLYFDILWALRNNVGFLRFIKYFFDFYAPVYMLFLCVLSFYQDFNKKIFYWKVWSLAGLFIFLFAVFQWQFSPSRNYFNLFGLDWQWCAVAVWSLMFAILIYLYNMKTLPFHAWLLSLVSLRLAGIAYEVPWYLQTGKWQIELVHPRFMFTMPIMMVLLYKYRWKPDLLFFLTFIPLILNWIFYYNLPANFGWLPRLSTFPLFILTPKNLSNTLKNSTKNIKNDSPKS